MIGTLEFVLPWSLSLQSLVEALDRGGVHSQVFRSAGAQLAAFKAALVAAGMAEYLSVVEAAVLRLATARSAFEGQFGGAVRAGVGEGAGDDEQPVPYRSIQALLSLSTVQHVVDGLKSRGGPFMRCVLPSDVSGIVVRSVVVSQAHMRGQPIDLPVSLHVSLHAARSSTRGFRRWPSRTCRRR